MKKISQSSSCQLPPPGEAEPLCATQGQAGAGLATSSSRDKEIWNNEAKRRGSFHVIREVGFVLHRTTMIIITPCLSSCCSLHFIVSPRLGLGLKKKL